MYAARTFSHRIRRSIFLLAIILSSISSVVYSKGEFIIIIPNWLTSLENPSSTYEYSERRVQLTITNPVLTELKGLSFSQDTYSEEKIKSSPLSTTDFAAGQDLYSNPQGGGQASVVVDGNLLGIKAKFTAISGEQKRTKVLLMTRSTVGGPSPISTSLRSQSGRDSSHRINSSAIGNNNDLHFSFLLTRDNDQPNMGLRNFIVQEMYGSDKRNIPAIRQQWLSKMVEYYANQMNVFSELQKFNPITPNQAQHVYVIGTINADTSCILRFRMDSIPSSHTPLLAIRGSSADYEAMEGVNTHHVLSLTGGNDGEFELKNLNSDTGTLSQSSHNLLKMGEKPDRFQPFFISGWHNSNEPDDSASSETLNYNYTTEPFTDWDITLKSQHPKSGRPPVSVPASGFEQKVIGGLQQLNVNASASTSPSRQRHTPDRTPPTSNTSTMRSTTSTSSNDSGSGSGGGVVMRKKNPSSSSYPLVFTSEDQDYELVTPFGDQQELLGYRLDSAMEHYLFHKKGDAWLSKIKDVTDAKLAYRSTAKHMRKYARALTPFKDKSKGGKITQHIKTATLASDKIENAITTNNELVPLVQMCSPSLNSLKECKIISLETESISDDCEFCRTKAEPDLPALFYSFKQINPKL